MTVVNYTSDGSGRDHYISVNSGGYFFSNGVSKPVNATYQNSLRSESFVKRVLPSVEVLK